MSPLDYQSFNVSTQVALRLQLKFKGRGQVILLHTSTGTCCNVITLLPCYLNAAIMLINTVFNVLFIHVLFKKFGVSMITFFYIAHGWINWSKVKNSTLTPKKLFKKNSYLKRSIQIILFSTLIILWNDSWAPNQQYQNYFLRIMKTGVMAAEKFAF